MSDILSFVNKMAIESRHGDSRRQAIFENSSEIKAVLSKDYSDNSVDKMLQIASSLVKCEFEYNKVKGGFNKIRKGSLLIAGFNQESKYYILIAKIDIENFFETKQFKLLSGLPQEKGVYKTCLVECADNTILDEIYLSDKNPSISKFWWHNFIKCNFVRDSQKNTLESFTRLSSVLNRVSKISEVDCSMLKGNLASYFTTAKNFNVNEMLERVVGNYKPENEDVDTSVIKKDLSKICSGGKFDTSFDIDIYPIKGKIKKVIRIDDDIELKIKSGDVSKVFHFEHNKSIYIAVKAGAGYKNFRKLNIDES